MSWKNIRKSCIVFNLNLESNLLYSINIQIGTYQYGKTKCKKLSNILPEIFLYRACSFYFNNTFSSKPIPSFYLIAFV